MTGRAKQIIIIRDIVITVYAKINSKTSIGTGVFNWWFLTETQTIRT